VDRSFTPRPHIDLPGAIALQLQRAGLPRVQIDRTDRCTYRDGDEFFSHRRDAGRTGRNAAMIGVT
jgi:copper oxidase (laccase) domain-containing protein